MLKTGKTQKIILAALCIFGLNSAFELPTAQAVYRSKTDTATDLLDYIENQRRERREKQLTPEQEKLLADIEKTKKNLPKPINAQEPAPIAFEGDDLSYNTLTGEFMAKGNVDIIQIEGYRFQSKGARGNLNTQDVIVDGKAHVLQMTQNAPRVTLDGYNAVYNYGTKEGTMESAKGKAGEYYISGKRFEFYPDHLVAYDAYQTKCGAKNPDYRVAAKRMEIWPEQIIRMYNVRFLIGEVTVGSKEYYERKLEESEPSYFPKVGYNSSNGAYVEDTFEFPMFDKKHFKFIINAHLETKKGVRSSAEFLYSNKALAVRPLYGYYYDDNGNWVKKEPGIDILYKKHFDDLPLTYSLEYEIGRWASETISSRHQKVEVGLSHDPIDLGNKYTLFLSTSYRYTKDNVYSMDGEKLTVRGMNYSIRISKEFNDRWASYIGYDYTKNNSQNSLYDYGNDDYSNKFITGVSYRLTDKDRFVVGLKFDTKNHKLADADYYWYRDLHCSTAVVRWRQKRHKVEFQWQFTPW